jgi:hypothetical protein
MTMGYPWRRSLLSLPVDADIRPGPFNDRLDAAAAKRLGELRDGPVVVVLGERGPGRSVTLQQEHCLLAEQCLNTAPLVHLGQDVFDTDIYAGTLM